MEGLKQIKSRTLVLPNKDIDTDQIIPARFLTTTSKNGLGKHLFHDWRYHDNGEKNTDFILNKNQNEMFEILVAGNNFGCGSSREHAPWALTDYGFKAVISYEIDEFSKYCIIEGIDQLGFIQRNNEAILKFEEKREWTPR